MGQTPSDEAGDRSKGPLVDDVRPTTSKPIQAPSRPGQDGKHTQPPTEPAAYTSSPPASLTDRVRKTLAAEEDRSIVATAQQQQAAIETVPVTFRWAHGAREVFITGSFNGWMGKIHMPRVEEGPGPPLFQLTIDIPPGQHQYKYIVDEQWRLDPDAPTCINQGVVNNLIDVKRPVFEDPRPELSAALVDSDDELDDNKQRVSYGQHVPAPEDYVKEPLRLPPHLQPVLLNSPNGLGLGALAAAGAGGPAASSALPPPATPTRHTSLHAADSASRSLTSASPATVDVPASPETLASVPTASHTAPLTSPSFDPFVLPLPDSHVTLNHLYVYRESSTDSGVVVTGITQRFKLKSFASLTPKFVTTVYYTPKQPSANATEIGQAAAAAAAATVAAAIGAGRRASFSHVPTGSSTGESTAPVSGS